MISECGDVVVVPFPFVDMPVAKIRPALVVSARAFNAANQQTVLAMITTAAASHWQSDTRINDWADAGLRTVCVVRMKPFTLENNLIQRRIGRLSASDRARFGQVLSESLTNLSSTATHAG